MDEIKTSLSSRIALLLIALMFLPMQGIASAEEDLATVKSFNGRRIGIFTGSAYEDPTYELFPDSEYFFYNSNTDLATALAGDKIDGFLGDEPTVRMVCQEYDGIMVLPEMVTHDDYGFAFGKDSTRAQTIRTQFNEFLSGIKADGTLDELSARWFGADKSVKTVDLTGFSGENGALNVSILASLPPFSYVGDNQYTGMVLEITAMFCREYGYTPVIEDVDGSAWLMGLISGKYDVFAAPVTITEERKESISFSDPFYTGGIAMVVRAADVPDGALAVSSGSNASSDPKDFWTNLKASFQRTFIREDRWRMFLDGVETTLIITVLAMIFGTALGFGLFMLCRNGNALANAVTRFCVWLVSGMPMVVLLMILYYVVFGSVAISGMWVAVIGFTLTFGASVFGMLKMGVGAVDAGQYEAAYALGHTNRHTFFRIILPQAIPHALPAFQSEVVNLIKATAIVGYIAVQDLTKMGDLVRSRTYEAFFPLIAVTVIYFVLEALLAFLVSRISLQANPRRRRRENILKGVNTHD